MNILMELVQLVGTLISALSPLCGVLAPVMLFSAYIARKNVDTAAIFAKISFISSVVMLVMYVYLAYYFYVMAPLGGDWTAMIPVFAIQLLLGYLCIGFIRKANKQKEVSSE